MADSNPIKSCLDQLDVADFTNGDVDVHALGQKLVRCLRFHKPFVRKINHVSTFFQGRWETVDAQLLGFYLKEDLARMLASTPHLRKNSPITRNLDPHAITSEYDSTELMQLDVLPDQEPCAQLIDSIVSVMLDGLAQELRDKQTRSHWIDDDLNKQTVEE